jgi:2-succinyl-5-enolpyruvyl-6-hydroxy-3-cyclohexene-1-carboxylate synthase
MRAANAGQAMALVLVDELRRLGLTHAFVAPGSRSTPLALSLVGQEGIQTHVVIDERSAAFCALGLAKRTKRPVAVVCTSGTAAANFYPAVIEADRSRTPLLVLTADRPPELRHTGANQTIDQIKLYGDAVRWFVEVGVPEALPGSVRYWRSTICRAWAEALGSPAGPVHLNLAFRDPLVPVADPAGFPFPLDGRSDGQPWTTTSRPSRGPADGDLEDLVSLAGGTERGIVVAGECPGAAGAAAIARRLGWPLLADPLSEARSGEGAISTYEALLRHPGFAAAMVPDVVIRVGRLGASRPLANYLAPEVRQVIVDPDGGWADPGRSAASLVRADPRLVAEALPEHPRSSAWRAAWLRAEEVARRTIDAELDGDDTPSEPRVARDVAAGCPEGTTLLVASSMPVRDVESFMRPRPGIRLLGNRGASGIDGFVSTAVGAALCGEGPTVALAGDLSVLHDTNGLLAARDLPVDLVVVVVNNDGGGIFSFLPQADLPEHFERLFGTPHGLSFEALAGVYGCGYEHVQRAGDLPGALQAALDAGRVRLLEVRTDRAANVALHRRLWQAVSDALSAEGF